MFTNLANELGHHMAPPCSIHSSVVSPNFHPDPSGSARLTVTPSGPKVGAQPPCVGKIFCCLELPQKTRVECVYASFLGRIM
jgi:hypothetical protein